MSDAPIFDKQIFSGLCDELGREDTAEILSVFLKDTGTKIELCAASDGDRHLVKRETHSIKSSAGTFGFLGLSNAARELERGALELSHVQFRKSIAVLRGAFSAAVLLAESLLRVLVEEPAQ